MLKTLAKSIREYKKPALLTPVFVIIEVILDCIIPFIIAELVNVIKDGGDLNDILKSGAVLAVMAVLSLIFGICAAHTCSDAACGFAKNLRADMFARIQSFSFENIDRFTTSSLVTRLTTDVTYIQDAYMMIIRTAIRSPLMLIFAFIMAFIMGGSMAWIFVFVVPVLGGGLFLIIKKAMPRFRSVFKKYDRLNASIQENIKGIRVVKSFVREDYENKKFGAAASDIARDFTIAERIVSLDAPLMQFCLYAVMVLNLTVGSYMIVTTGGTRFDVGQLSAFLTYGFMMLNSLMMLSMIFVMITLADESCKRVCEVLREEPTLSSPESPLYEVKDGSVEFRGVSFKYSKKAKRNALEHIELKIRSGETIGIIGGTGSSKSSLVQLIPRLYDVTEGSVFVGGEDVRIYDLDTLRNSVAVVLQKNLLFSGTIKENLRWGHLSI